ncbi:uncharacterized protein An15g05500 [Aspergillus niger]|uniref:Contig An15c0190, genomic contig n=2 Tax=Aspergillus niger TaxID=5061 RepID=A2R5T6_ASPNC|nr:uncharacterized protein An15g05500 [Aspergillus niger]CAK97335.1 unnamed protein product [Aspergillus niger]
MKSSWAILALAFGSHVVAKGFSPTDAAEYCMYAIYESLSELSWQESANETSSEGSNSASPCSNEIEVTSIYASVVEYCHGASYSQGLVFWDKLCANLGTSLTGLDDLEASVTTAYIEQLPAISPDTAGKTEISTPVLLEKSYYSRAVRSVTANETRDTSSINIAWGIHGFWGFIVLMGIVQNVFSTLSRRCAGVQAGDIEKPQSRRWREIIPAPVRWAHDTVYTYLILSPALGYNHRRLLGFNVPLRAQGLTIFFFWSLAVILAYIHGGVYRDDPFNGTFAYQIWVFMGPRLGFLAFACLPWLWLFAGRNNIFIWGTGWDYQTFNLFHRHLARVTVIYAILHSISYTVKYLAYCMCFTHQARRPCHAMLTNSPSPEQVLQGPRNKLVPLRHCGHNPHVSPHSLLLGHPPQALLRGLPNNPHPLRHSHRLCLIHFGTEYTPHLWPVVAIWSFDRLARLLRLVVTNIHVRSRRVSRTARSTVGYSDKSDVLRIEIQPAAVPRTPRAGDVYYLYQPRSWRGWENHPFTLASWAYAGDGVKTPAMEGSVAMPMTDVSGSGSGPACGDRRSDSSPALPRRGCLDIGTITADIDLLRRPYEGWTKRLKEQCLRSGYTCHPTLHIEGPYGHRVSLGEFEHVVMITGGTGISVATAYLQDLLGGSRGDGEGGDGYGRSQQIDLHWTVREAALFGELCQRELAAPEGNSMVQMRFYCSREQGLEGVDREALGGRVVEKGRAPTQDIISKAAAEARVSCARVAVLVCGPVGMADEARKAVCEARKEYAGVEYFEEVYGW